MPVQPQAGSYPGTSLSGGDIVKSALRLVGVVASGENPTALEMADSLSVLNQMLDALNTERLAIFQVNRQVFSLTSTKQIYTTGTGGDFNIPRPPKIDWVSLIYSGNPPQPLEMPVKYITDQKEWRSVTLKSQDSMFPAAVYDDQAFPLRNLSFWPVPNINLQAVLYSWAPLTQFADATTVVTFPPGYYEMIRYNLAIRLAAEFPPAAVTQALASLAAESMARVKSMNIPNVEMSCDDALLNPGGASWVRFVSGY